MSHRCKLVFVTVAVLAAGACSDVGRGSAADGLPVAPSANPAIGAEPDARPAAVVTLVGAGDIASCNSTGDEATARLLDGIAGTVVTLGDNAYPAGASSDFSACYAPSWGRHLMRTRPVPGNHDYGTTGASGYFAYFGALAGNPAKGFYSYNRGDWHIIALNSNLDCTVIACARGSAQERWLRADLAANPKTCTLAYWHHPRFNSGEKGNDTTTAQLWRVLYAANVDVILNGHEHIYERFAPQNPNAVADPARGIRQFTVGTGGEGHTLLKTVQPNSQVREANTFGVLKLTLRPSSYDWVFVPVAGSTFTDSGSASCH